MDSFSACGSCSFICKLVNSIGLLKFTDTSHYMLGLFLWISCVTIFLGCFLSISAISDNKFRNSNTGFFFS